MRNSRRFLTTPLGAHTDAVTCSTTGPPRRNTHLAASTSSRFACDDDAEASLSGSSTHSERAASVCCIAMVTGNTSSRAPCTMPTSQGDRGPVFSSHQANLTARGDRHPDDHELALAEPSIGMSPIIATAFPTLPACCSTSASVRPLRQLLHLDLQRPRERDQDGFGMRPRSRRSPLRSPLVYQTSSSSQISRGRPPNPPRAASGQAQPLAPLVIVQAPRADELR